MPALDFPANPTNGQVYANWIYSTSKGAWQARPLTGPKTITEDVPPANPQDGDQWFNTIDGTLYVWVVDIDGGQWVESQAPITANGYYSPNYIINGGFDINQRGTTSSPGGGAAWCSDRWQASGLSSTSVNDLTPGELADTGLMKYLRLSRTSNVGNYPSIETHIEDVRSVPSGVPITLSFYARQATAFNAGTWYVGWFQSFGTGGSASNGNLTVQAFTLTSSWQRYTFTFTVDSIAGKTVGANSFLNILLRNNGNTQTAGQIDVTGIQLESGAVATTFRRNANSLEGELAACQRYFESGSSTDIYLVSNNSYSQYTLGTGNYPVIYFKVAKRVSPTIRNWYGGTANVANVLGSNPANGVFNSSTSSVQFGINSVGSSGNTQAYFGWDANAEL